MGLDAVLLPLRVSMRGVCTGRGLQPTTTWWWAHTLGAAVVGAAWQVSWAKHSAEVAKNGKGGGGTPGMPQLKKPYTRPHPQRPDLPQPQEVHISPPHPSMTPHSQQA